VSPFAVAAVVVIVMPLAWFSSTGKRLAMHDGDLVVTSWWWWGMKERIAGKLDGGAGRWWITYPDGRVELYQWEGAPAVLKVSPKVAPGE
jgi:hypothetical protein